MSGKRHIKPAAKIIALLAVSLFVSPLMADMTVSLKGYGPFRLGSGGEFSFYLEQGWDPGYLDLYDEKAAPLNNAIQTFCLEKSERLYRHRTYDVNISNYAQYGGKNRADNAIAGQDNISRGTAWLYEKFAAGTLEGYNYNLRFRWFSGFILQRAIWALEDELPMACSYGNKFIKLLTESGQFSSIEEAKQDYLGSNVGVMNLTYNGKRMQDQLFLKPVPAPGAITLAGIGVVITAIRKRKFFA